MFPLLKQVVINANLLKLVGVDLFLRKWPTFHGLVDASMKNQKRKQEVKHLKKEALKNGTAVASNMDEDEENQRLTAAEVQSQKKPMEEFYKALETLQLSIFPSFTRYYCCSWSFLKPMKRRPYVDARYDALLYLVCYDLNGI